MKSKSEMTPVFVKFIKIKRKNVVREFCLGKSGQVFKIDTVELPTQTARFRYMIFGKDGKAVNATPETLRDVCLNWIKENVK